MAITTTKLEHRMALQGYLPSEPPEADQEMLEIDRQACREATCERCGGRRLRYQPFYHPKYRRYRAFMDCRACGWQMEF